jgi:hypothetical protein
MIRIDSKAWDEGFKAGETIRSWPGESRCAVHCPYPPASIEALSWHSGFIEGDAKRQGYSYSRGARE